MDTNPFIDNFDQLSRWRLNLPEEQGGRGNLTFLIFNLFFFSFWDHWYNLGLLAVLKEKTVVLLQCFLGPLEIISFKTHNFLTL